MFLSKMKCLFYLSLAVGLVATSSAIAQSPQGQVGNGGGGVSRGGRPMTFYSAGIIVEQKSLTAREIPEIDSLLKVINSNPYVSASTKSQLTQAIDPSLTRQYFRIKPDQFDKKAKDRIMAEYARIAKVDTSQITLFAITDTSQKITYLLPDFYRLSFFEKIAILYHEAYWILNPSASYNHIVEAEFVFQAYLENQSSMHHLFAWITATEPLRHILEVTIALDLQSGALNELIQANRYLSMSTLLGNDFINCLTHSDKRPRYSWFADPRCNSFAINFLYVLKEKFKSSYFLNYVYTLFRDKEIIQSSFDPEMKGPYSGSDRSFKPGCFSPGVPNQLSLDLRSPYFIRQWQGLLFSPKNYSRDCPADQAILFR